MRGYAFGGLYGDTAEWSVCEFDQPEGTPDTDSRNETVVTLGDVLEEVPEEYRAWVREETRQAIHSLVWFIATVPDKYETTDVHIATAQQNLRALQIQMAEAGFDNS